MDGGTGNQSKPSIPEAARNLRTRSSAEARKHIKACADRAGQPTLAPQVAAVMQWYFLTARVRHM
jgi:hypothetical protein